MYVTIIWEAGTRVYGRSRELMEGAVSCPRSVLSGPGSLSLSGSHTDTVLGQGIGSVGVAL